MESMQTKSYNVALTVVALVEAGSEAEAINILRGKVRAAGLDEYDGQPPDAFESEDQGLEWPPLVRRRMFARLTPQGTAASETALCEDHRTHEIAASSRGEQLTELVDCTGNEELQCGICGAVTIL